MGFFIYCNTFSSSFELNISFRHFQNNKLKWKNTSLGGARTHESIIYSGQKFFVRFLVQVKIVESLFEINWPLEREESIQGQYGMHKVLVLVPHRMGSKYIGGHWNPWVNWPSKFHIKYWKQMENWIKCGSYGWLLKVTYISTPLYIQFT